MRTSGLLLLTVIVTACVSTRPDAGAFESAEQGIRAAIRAGAEELAPVELRFAREKLESARLGLENGHNDIALWLVEESEINSELAIEKCRAVKSRRKVNEMQRAVEILREELSVTYPDAFQ